MFHFKYRSKAGREFEIGLDGGVWLLVLEQLYGVMSGGG
jgi:hypothetical protein